MKDEGLFLSKWEWGDFEGASFPQELFAMGINEEEVKRRRNKSLDSYLNGDLPKRSKV